MPTLGETIETEHGGNAAGSTHLLLIGETKTGKTDYIAQAAHDGYQILYVDKDNGLATLGEELKSEPDALARIQYFSPKNFANFVEGLLTLPTFRYNLRTKLPNAGMDKPDDKIVEIIPSRIPRNMILVLDSWTSLTLSKMENKAEDMKVDLTEIDRYGREIYQSSGFWATQMLSILQHVKFHVVVLAHPTVYERKERPPGQTATAIKEGDMIIRESTKIPVSTSQPHGATLGKFFNQIGWLEVDRMNNRVLDFTMQQGRMGGGTPNKKGDPRGSMRFSTLFGKPGEYPPVDTWMQTLTYEEVRAKAQSSSNIKLGAKPAVPTTPATPDASAPATPAPTQVSFSKLKLGGNK